MTTLICSIPEKLDASLERLAKEAKVPKAKFVRKALSKLPGKRVPVALLLASSENLVWIAGPGRLISPLESGFIWRVWVREGRVIIDTGPLVAFLVKQETHHRWVVDQFRCLRAPFLTCDAVLTETFFLIRKLPQGPGKVFCPSQ